jgi:hypothetical protein
MRRPAAASPPLLAQSHQPVPLGPLHRVHPCGEAAAAPMRGRSAGMER